MRIFKNRQYTSNLNKNLPIEDFHPPASKEQKDYIQILSDCLGFTTQQRNAHMADIVKRKIQFPDELSKKEASLVIGKFKEWRDSEKKL